MIHMSSAGCVSRVFFFMILNVDIHGMREIRLLRWPCGALLVMDMCVDKKHMLGQDFMRFHFCVCVFIGSSS